ncbi:MAG: zinc ribbon domain-containing protein [Polyangiaceae bacterium]
METVKDTVLATAPLARCRACDSPLPADSSTCSHCGAVYGEANRCPHCRAIAGTDARGGIARCRVCGGPRIALDDPGIVRSGNEVPWLEQAQRAALGISLTRFGSYAAWGAAGLVLLLSGLLGLALSSVVPALTVLAMAGALGGLGFFLNRWAARASKAQLSALEQARQLVATDILRQRPELEPAELGRMLGLDPEHTELLLAELKVGELLSGEPIRQRLDPLAPPAATPQVEDLAPVSAIPPTEAAPTTDVTEMAPPLADLRRRS